MLEIGRNEPCSCGSGRKYKRCCLEAGRAALRMAREVEQRIGALGDVARREAALAWAREFESKIGHLTRFGGVPAGEAGWLDSWLVTHAPVIDGRSPLEAAGDECAADDALRGSAFCGWWVRGGDFPLAAVHWRSEEPVTLHCAHEPLGRLEDDALVVGRGVEVADGHVALLGRPVVVDDAAVGDVLGVLAATPEEALFAALRWPEERTFTAEGDLVEHCSRRYGIDDPDAAIALLRATPGVVEDHDVLTYFEDDVEFKVQCAEPVKVNEPPSERGVIWDLCHEDRSDPPILGEVTVSPAEFELSISAPTRRRAERLFAALPSPVRGQLGELIEEDIDVPDVLPRVRRERIAALA